MVNNADNALLFLVDTLFALYIVVVLLRVVLQWVHADFRNPISQFVWQATSLPVGTLARVIPRWRNIDIPALVFAVILCFINIQIDLAIVGSAQQPGVSVAWAVLKALVVICNFYTFSILIQALISWISPGQYSPATALLWTINEPLLRPVRNVIPPIGGLDLSPLAVIIGLQVISRLLPLPVLLR